MLEIVKLLDHVEAPVSYWIIRMYACYVSSFVT